MLSEARSYKIGLSYHHLMQNCMLYIQFFTKFGAKSKTKHTFLHLIVKIRNLVRNQKQNIRFRTKYRFFFNYLNSSKFEYSHEDLLLKAFAPAFRIFFLCSRSMANSLQIFVMLRIFWRSRLSCFNWQFMASENKTQITKYTKFWSKNE